MKLLGILEELTPRQALYLLKGLNTYTIHNPATACLAVFFFFFPLFFPVKLPLLLPVLMLLTLPLTLFFFLFAVPFSPITPDFGLPVPGRPLPGLASVVTCTLFLRPSFFRRCASRWNFSSSFQKSSLNISQPSMKSPSIPPRWLSTTLTPPSPSAGLGRKTQRRMGRLRRGWETGLGTNLRLNWRSDLFVWERYFFGYINVLCRSEET